MAASNIKTAITSLIINLGTYFLGLIVLFQHRSDMYQLHTMFVSPTWLPNGYRKQNMQHYINNNQMYMLMAYNETHLLHSLCALYTRYMTHSKHFSHYLGRGHHCDCPSLHHMHVSFAHGWSVVQPNMITLIISRGARAAPSGTVTGSNDFESSSFSHPSLLISTRSGWSFSNTVFQTVTWKCASLTFCWNAQDVRGMDSSFGESVTFLCAVFLLHNSYLVVDVVSLLAYP